jgi:alkylation response protein AidB-like acyl-CoA dehydrogenase
VQFKLTDEQQMMVDSVRALAEKEFKPHLVEWDQARGFPRKEVAKKLRDLGLLGMTLPKAHGGAGMSFLDYILALEPLAEATQCAALVLTSSCGGPVSHLLEFGSPEVKAKFLPLLSSGEMMCAIAMTESEAGSDTGAMKTRAVIEGDEVVINGTKLFVGGSGAFEMMVAYVRMSDAPGTEGLGSVLITQDAPGLKYGRVQEMMGLRAVPRAEIIFDNCRVPKSQILTRPGQFKQMINSFNSERIHNAMFCVGQGQAALDEALAYARMRKQFGRRIGDFQGIRWKLADMGMRLQAARLLVYHAAAKFSAGENAALEASMAKTFASEAAFEAGHQAMQICGANGYAAGSRVEVLFRDIRGHMLGGGSVEAVRNYIGKRMMDG